MTVGEILGRSAAWLGKKGFESARLEAELLLAHLLGVDRVGLYTDRGRPLADEEVDAYRELLRQRAQGEPVAYLTGQKEFYSLPLKVTRDVLVPRPETELLVDRARELAPERLLDLGTGSGCIAIACAKHLERAAITATDVSAAALAVARENAERHGVAGRVRFLEGDLFEAVPAGEAFDLVVSNPPYVPDGFTVGTSEPHDALHAGPRGLDVIARVVAEAPARLAPGGTLLLEIGEDQAEEVRALASARFPDVLIRPDLARRPRMLEARQAAS